MIDIFPKDEQNISVFAPLNILSTIVLFGFYFQVGFGCSRSQLLYLNILYLGLFVQLIPLHMGVCGFAKRSFGILVLLSKLFDLDVFIQ